MTVIETPSATARQVSGMDADSRYFLSVLVKRTYRLGPDGRCTLAEEQSPLREEPAVYGHCSELLEHDLDLYPSKPATDVVIKGHAYSYTPIGQFEVSIRIGGQTKKIAVFGDRSCGRSHSGQIEISTPQPIDKVPLRYDQAYGGRDAVAEARLGNPLEALESILPEMVDISLASPFIYPRNRCGMGYLIEATPDAIEQLRLPHLEDPLDLLSPDRIEVGHPAKWLDMPLPQATDWVDLSWFPRIAYTGLLPDFEPPQQVIREVLREHAPSDILEEKPLHEKFSGRMTNGASLGLQVPYLTGGEGGELVNIHPTQPCFSFQLPDERPKIWTDGRKGKLNTTKPVIHAVVIEPDEDCLTIVWRGSAPALRPYMPEELENMPLRVEWA